MLSLFFPMRGMGGGQPSGGATPWYLAGGAPAPVAVYQPLGAVSLAASYVNLVNPGVNNAVPVVPAPTLAASGWVMNGASTYLMTGLFLGANWTVIVAYSGMTPASGSFLYGAFEGTNKVGVAPVQGSNIRWDVGTEDTSLLAANNTGVLGIAGNKAYRDGVAEAVSFTNSNAFTTRDLWLGALNNGGTDFGEINVTIRAVAIYNVTLSASQMATVMGAAP